MHWKTQLLLEDRPRLDQNARRDKLLGVRLSVEERTRVRVAAERAGMPPSVWARQVILAAIADPNAIVAVGDEAGSVEAAERRAALRRVGANLNQSLRHLHGGGDADLRPIVLELRDVIALEVKR